jgi:transcription-repair coupling factor (superfamily II helicase)
MTNTKPKNAATIPVEVSPSSPPGAIAVLLLSMWKESLDRSLVFLSASERAAEQLGSILYGLDPQSDPLVLPRWDALPYDRAAPSREVAGRRASVLRRLSERPKKALLLATAEAALQRVPAPNVWSDTTLCLRPGMALDESALRSFLERSGYELGGRVDTPGEAAIEGQVIDIFSAGGLSPVRVVHAEGRVTALSAYDPASQRTREDIAEVTIDPASEMTVVDTEDSPAGRPLRLPATFFDYVRGAALIIDPGVEKRVDAWLDQVAEAYESSKWQPGLHPTTGAASMPPSDLYLDKREWRAALGRHTILDWPDTSSIDLRVPKFAAAPSTS